MVAISLGLNDKTLPISAALKDACTGMRVLLVWQRERELGLALKASLLTACQTDVGWARWLTNGRVFA